MRVIRKSSLSPLRNKTIAIIGYGAQGRAQALNMRDSGYRPTVGLPSRSSSRVTARRDGMTVRSVSEAARNADIIFLLAPDHLHGTIYRREIAPILHAGQMLVFAHGSSVHFGALTPQSDIDVVLLAPLGPGKRLRELHGQRDGVACFFSVHQDATGKARSVGLALAKAVGCLPAGAIETTFAEEAVGDLFGEQAVLCGGLSALLQAGVETLIAHGAKPANAYLECVYQIDLIVDLIKSEGMRGMFKQISPTAAYGASIAGPRVISPAVRKQMNILHREIESGRFFQQWLRNSAKLSSRQPKISREFVRAESEIRKALGKTRYSHQ